MRVSRKLVVLVLVVAAAVSLSAQVRFADIFRFNNGTLILSSSADPEGAVTAPMGSKYFRTSNGKWYRKNSGSGNTGWLQVSPVFFTASDRLLCRDTASAGDGEECTVTQVLDMLGSTQGSIFYRGAAGWTVLLPGSSGECLTSGGVGGDPSYAACVGGAAGVTAASPFGTDNRIIRSDGTGKGVQASGWTIDDSDIGTGILIDAEGSGNTLTIPSVFVAKPAFCQGATAMLALEYLANAPTAACSSGSNITRGVAQFPDSDGDYGLIYTIPLPGDWAGTMDVRGKWRTSATSGDVVFQVKWACTADGEVDNDTWSSASTTTDTAKGTTLQWNTWAITGVSVTGCAPDEDLEVLVFRNRTSGSDTLAATLDLRPFYLVLRRAM